MSLNVSEEILFSNIKRRSSPDMSRSPQTHVRTLAIFPICSIHAGARAYTMMDQLCQAIE